MLYSYAPIGAVTTIVPALTAHVGCTVTEAVGAAGCPGEGFTVSTVTGEIHVISAVRLAVTL